MASQPATPRFLVCPECGMLSRPNGDADQRCWLCGGALEPFDQAAIDFGDALRLAWHEGVETFPDEDRICDLEDILYEVAPHLGRHIELLHRACDWGWYQLLRQEWRAAERWEAEGADRVRVALRRYEREEADEAAGDDVIAAYDSLHPLLVAYTEVLLRGLHRGTGH